MEQGDKCFLWPMARNVDGTFTVPDELLRIIWERISEEGKGREVFWGGSVQTEDQFFDLLKSPSNHPVIVVDREKNDIAFLAWLNNYADKVAMAHFCGVGVFRPEYPKKVMKYWAAMKDAAGQPLIRTVIGVIPTVNEKAIRMIKSVGWIVLGEIPDCLEMMGGRRSGATVSFYSTENWR